MEWNETFDRIVLETPEDRDRAFDIFDSCLHHDRGETRPRHRKSGIENFPHTLSRHASRLVLRDFERVAGDARDKIGIGQEGRRAAYLTLLSLNDGLGDSKDTELESRIRQALEVQEY